MAFRPPSPKGALHRALLPSILASVLLASTSGLQAQFVRSHGPTSHGAAAPPPTRDPVGAEEGEAWRRDLELLTESLVEHHARPFHSTSEAALDAAMRTLHARIPELARHEILVAMAQIAAQIGDGHTAVSLALDPAVGFWALPVRLGLWEEGLFVVSARSADPSVGAKVLRLDGHPVDEVLRTLASVISHENEHWLRAQAPSYLVLPQVLHALGLATQPDSVTATLQAADGARFEHTWRAISPREAPPLPFWAPPRADADWEHAFTWAGDAPPESRLPEQRYWMELLEGTQTLYVQLDGLQHAPHGPTIPDFFAQVEHRATRDDVERLVLDLRRNVGGNGFLARHVVRSMVRLERLDDPRRLFVLIGRHTYSAGQQLVNELERFTKATFVGEPTGSPPNSYGDHVDVRLPHSGVELRVAPVWHQSAGPFDRRSATLPDVAAPPRFEHLVAGSDPALAAIDRWLEQPRLDDLVRTALASGDTGALGRSLETFREDPLHHFLRLDGELNRIGYELWGDGQLAAAARLFRVNVELHPTYANGFDSLGEALHASGDLEGARTAFERALEIDPHLAATVEKLARVKHRLETER